MTRYFRFEKAPQEHNSLSHYYDLIDEPNSHNKKTNATIKQTTLLRRGKFPILLCFLFNLPESSHLYLLLNLAEANLLSKFWLAVFWSDHICNKSKTWNNMKQHAGISVYIFPDSPCFSLGCCLLWNSIEDHRYAVTHHTSYMHQNQRWF